MKTYSEFYEEAKTNYGKNTEGHLQTGPEFDLYSFCIWDRVLTAQEIKQNFEAQRTRFGV